MLGWKAEEMPGQSGTRIFTAEHQEQGMPQRELEAARNKGRGEDDRWHVRKDGSRFWGSGVFVPLKEGAPSGFVKIIRDRTQEQLQAAALRRNEPGFARWLRTCRSWCGASLRTWREDKFRSQAGRPAG